MKKYILLFVLCIFSFFTGLSVLNEASADDEYTGKTCSTGKKVVIHYKPTGNNLESAGLWTWENGTGGSSDGVAKSGTDDFGVVVELCVGSDAATTGVFFGMTEGLTQDTSAWPGDYKDGVDISYDRTALINGDTNELHLYYVGGESAVTTTKPVFYTPKTCPTGKKVVVHYLPSNDNLESAGLWTWDNGTGGSADGVSNSGKDDFGAIVELCVGSDAATTGVFFGMTEGLAEDTSAWPGDFQDGLNISYDRTALINGDTDELHLYYVGGESTASTTKPEVVDRPPVNSCPNKVIVHYKRFDENYDTVGMWTWSNGTGGSADGVAKTGVDDFGAVIELCVGDNVGNVGNIIPISQGLAENTKTFPGDQYKDAYNQMTLEYDRSAIVNGETDVLDIYFIQGNDRVFYMDNTKPAYNKDGFGTVTIVYFDTTSVKDTTVYDDWGIKSWNTGTNGTTGLNPFQWDLITSEGYKMKVAVINVAADQSNTTENPGVGFSIEKLDESGKKYSENIFIDTTDIVGSGDKVVFYAANKTSGLDDVVYTYDEFVVKYNGLFSNDFVEFDPIESTGTYGKDKTTVLVELKKSISTDGANTKFILKDKDGNEIDTVVTAVDAADGKANKFEITVSQNMDKNKEYTLYYNGDEASIVVDLDKNSPMISYTNNVRFNSELYDELNDKYFIQLNTEFNLEDYIRLNVVDDREGNVTDEVELTNVPDTTKPGVYNLTLTITDSWDNKSEKVFTFEVVGEIVAPEPEVEPKTNYYPIIFGGIGGLVILSGVFVFIKRRK